MDSPLNFIKLIECFFIAGVVLSLPDRLLYYKRILFLSAKQSYSTSTLVSTCLVQCNLWNFVSQLSRKQAHQLPQLPSTKVVDKELFEEMQHTFYTFFIFQHIQLFLYYTCIYTYTHFSVLYTSYFYTASLQILPLVAY